MDFLLQNRYFGVLAAETQHSCSGHIGMMNIAGEQTTKRPRVLARASAAALVEEELDAVDISEQPLGKCASRSVIAVRLSLQCGQFPHLLAVLIVASVSEFFFECFAKQFHVAVFAEDERQYEPIIPGAYLTVRAAISIESALLPFGNIWSGPLRVVTLGGESIGFVAKIFC